MYASTFCLRLILRLFYYYSSVALASLLTVGHPTYQVFLEA